MTAQRPANPARPNILFILVDQMRYPPSYGGPDPLDPLYQILRFQPGSVQGNRFADQFPGFCRLRQNGVSLQNHTISSAACVPSRATIMTGQYSARTGVTQTEGMFKVDTDPAFPWLPSDGVPTMGDWFRAAGYETHYFGRWDLSNPPTGDLEQWGFSDWEYSYPSDQRFGVPNLGVYRDKGYVDLVNTFLRRKALGVEANVINSNNATNASFKQRPWLAVASFVNPHDIGAYPFPWKPGVQRPDGALGPYGAPPQGTLSNPPQYGNRQNGYQATYQVHLNPGGFAPEGVRLPPNLHSDLRTKPECQYDYAYKFQLALRSLRWAVPDPVYARSPYPFQLQPNGDDWYRGYLEFYLYLQYLVNIEVSSILSRVYECGLDQNTIIVFTSDHGELGGAHGGQLEKWHNAYQESIHVPAIVSSPLVNPDAELRSIDAHSTHVDWIPTLLGLAGFSAAEQQALGSFIQGHDVFPLVGEDLSQILRSPAQGRPGRRGVLFVNQDTITEALDPNYLPAQFADYQQGTLALTAQGANPPNPPLQAPGPVIQPNNVQSYFQTPWKLTRYWDPAGGAAPQWELYNLDVDPLEDHNLVRWSAAGEPELRSEEVGKLGLTVADAEAALTAMRVELKRALAQAGYEAQSV
jgi:arylsulfatase A-like enzyme